MPFKKPPLSDGEPVEIEESMDKVLAWRVESLEGMGFEPTLALRLASDRSVNLHEVKQTLSHGCSHHLAAEIFG